MVDMFDHRDRLHPRTPEERPSRSMLSGGELLQQFFRSHLSPTALRRLRWNAIYKQGGASQLAAAPVVVRREVTNEQPLVVGHEEQEDALVVDEQDNVTFTVHL